MGSLPPREGRLEVYAQAEIARTYDRRWSQARGRRRDLRKQRALAKALESLEGALGRPLGTILDAPCGTGRFGAFWSARKLPMGGSRAALVLGLDGSLPMLHQAQAKAWGHPLAAGDLARLPLVSGAVDVVVCIRFMHLVRSSAARVEFLREAARVAGGGVIVDYRHGQTPRGVGRRLRGILARWFGQEGPRIWPGRAQALAEVQEAGMGLVGVVPVRRPWWIGDKLLLVARAPSLMAPPTLGPERGILGSNTNSGADSP